MLQCSSRAWRTPLELGLEDIVVAKQGLEEAVELELGLEDVEAAKQGLKDAVELKLGLEDVEVAVQGLEDAVELGLDDVVVEHILILSCYNNPEVSVK